MLEEGREVLQECLQTDLTQPLHEFMGRYNYGLVVRSMKTGGVMVELFFRMREGEVGGVSGELGVQVRCGLVLVW